MPRIGRLPTTASADGHRADETTTASSGPRRTSRHWLRHLAARRASLGSWDFRTNWGMMALWLLWAAYQIVMTLVRPSLACRGSLCRPMADSPILCLRSTPTPSSGRASLTCLRRSGVTLPTGEHTLGQFRPHLPSLTKPSCFISQPAPATFALPTCQSSFCWSRGAASSAASPASPSRSAETYPSLHHTPTLIADLLSSLFRT